MRFGTRLIRASMSYRKERHAETLLGASRPVGDFVSDRAEREVTRGTNRRGPSEHPFGLAFSEVSRAGGLRGGGSGPSLLGSRSQT